MNINPSPRVRKALYALTALGTPVVVYLQAKGLIGTTEVTLWAAEVMVISAMAGLNVNNTPEG